MGLPCNLIFLCSAKRLAIGLTYTLPPDGDAAGGATVEGEAEGATSGGIGGAESGGGGAAAVGAGFAACADVAGSSLKSLKAAKSDSSSTIMQTNFPENFHILIFLQH